jgi:uncharacterized protein (TIGR02118 family)
MIKVSVFYTNQPGAKFDLDYYCNKHIPLVRQKLGAACKRAAVEWGVCGLTPEASPPYIAMGHLYFDSVGTFRTAFAPHASEIMADVRNYTDIQPVLQISEVKIETAT